MAQYGTRMGFLHGWRVCPRCASELDAQDGRAACPACGSVYYATLRARRLRPRDGRRGLGAPRAASSRAGHRAAGISSAASSKRAKARSRDFGGSFARRRGSKSSPATSSASSSTATATAPAPTSVLNLVWRARIVAGDPAPADDVAELRWFSLSELPPPEECAFTWVGPFLAGLSPSSKTKPTRTIGRLSRPIGRGGGGGSLERKTSC